MSTKRTGRADILQGTLDMLLLRILSRESLHGHAVGKRLRGVSGDRLRIPQGSLYPALHRIEQHGLLYPYPWRECWVRYLSLVSSNR